MPGVAKEQIFRLTTAVTPFRCPLCQFTTYGGSSSAFNDVSNHILREHKLKCLHVGQETHWSGDEPSHSTVIVFGK